MPNSNVEIVKRGFEAFNRAVMVWELRDGQAIRLSLYPTLDQALAAIEQESST